MSEIERYPCKKCSKDIVIDPDAVDDAEITCPHCRIYQGKLFEIRTATIRQAGAKAADILGASIKNMRRWWGS